MLVRVNYKINDDLSILAIKNLSFHNGANAYVTNYVDYYISNTATQSYNNVVVRVGKFSTSPTVTIGNLEANTTVLLQKNSTIEIDELQKGTITVRADGVNVTLSIDETELGSTAGNWLDLYAAINSFTDEEDMHIRYMTNVNGRATGSIGILKPDVPVYIVSRDDIIDTRYSMIDYVYDFTEAERNEIRKAYNKAVTNKITVSLIVNVNTYAFYHHKDNLAETAQTYEHTPLYLEDRGEAILTIVNAEPIVNPTVKDIKLETLALTGDENTFIRYESMAEFAVGATAIKGAELVTQSATCESKTITDLPYGVIQDVESATFEFLAVDSRGLQTVTAVFKNLIEYVKPTCYQVVETELSSETGSRIKLNISGNYYNGSFGAVNNTLTLQVRYTDANGDMGSWITINDAPTFNGIKYSVDIVLTGFSYGNGYVIQSRAIDKLNTVESSQYTIKLLPVYDWGEEDFNFNVPVNINAEDLSMHGETILRHSETANNTVLSASNGNIYVRPGGTDNTSNETIFYSNGNVKFNGTVTLADGSTVSGDPLGELGDYVIEAGSTSMGSNGTWYWRKWNSGTAEAWGCRNFGNMAVTTAWGNLYRSAVFTQDLPDNVFVRTPDSININIVHATFGGWICKHEQTAPSAATTGSFIFVRPASATVTAPTNIGFYIVGEWK